MKKRLLHLFSIYVLTLLVFALAKVAFMVSNLSTQTFSLADMADVLVHGASLDLSTALYILGLPFLMTIAAVWTKGSRWLLKGYFAIIACALSLAFVADTSLYAFWHFKLDASCLQYLETPTEAMASVTTGYLVVRIVVFLLVAVALYLLYAKCVPTSLFERSRHLSHRIFETGLYVLLIPFIVIGIRGGLGESTTNIGQVYYSSNQFLNHSAVNPVFSFLSSIGKSGDYIVSYDYFSDEECRQLTDGLFPAADDELTDTLLHTNRPNIVILIMESCGGQFTAMGGHPEITPRLNQLSEEGVFFSECYANSWRTDKGVVSILSGYPAFPVTSVMKIPEKSRKLPSIASSLRQLGYATSFYYGGDINFTNMRSYVMGTGYEQLKWKADYSREAQQSAQWGVRDDLMLASLLDDIKSEQHEHWMKTLLTLSSHEPWDVPTHELDDPVYNAFNYLDRCIGQFIDSLRQTPAWQNLLVVILPDHGYRYQGIDETTRLYNHIPLIWTGGAVSTPRRIHAVCNQSDLAATLLAQMQTDHSAFTFSRNVVGENYVYPFAFHTFNNGMTVIDSTGFVAYDLDAEKTIASEGSNAQQQLQQARALLQLTSHDLIDGGSLYHR
jgi:phosphoglycerol transferase MdoB-like AlkP superfamily enzyme